MVERSSFGDVLRKHRSARGLTQQELAERARLSVRAISDLERGLKLAPRWSTLRLLIAALELPSSEAAGFLAAARGSVDGDPVASGGSAPPKSNLPAEVSTFIGRQWELAELPGQLSATRLLTLTGPGGVGKTRLALRLAAQLVERYPQGMRLVELAPLTDPGLLPHAFAAALGIREDTNRPALDVLCESLSPQTLLLIVDNCEHLADPCARLIEQLLRACPGLTVLGTSREPLAIAGETVWRVATLRLPPRATIRADDLSSFEAVQLFVERARSSAPAFRLTAHNAAAIERVCRRVDGLPLAIELAAARVGLLSVDEIADRLSDCLQLLVAGRRTAPSRHQTLRAALDWSYDLLPEEGRVLLDELSVFVGSCTLEAVEAVCGGGLTNDRSEILNRLGRLVDRSLVQAEPHEADGVRYRLHETLREYGLEHLRSCGELERVRRAHTDHYVALAQQAFDLMRGSGQADWLARLEREHDNLRACLAWALEHGDIEVAHRLGAYLWRFWWYRGHLAEGESWLNRLLEHPRPDSPNWRQVLFAAGRAAFTRGDLALARTRFESLKELSESDGDLRWQASALSQLCQIARDEGDYVLSRDLTQQALTMHQATGDRWGSANELEGLSLLALRDGDIQEARRLGEEALALVRELKDETRIAFVQASLSQVDMAERDLLGARARLIESITLFQQLENPVGLARALHCCAGLALLAGDFERAHRLAGASAGRRETVGFEFTWLRGGTPGPRAEAARAALGERRIEALQAAGRAMTLEEAIGDVLQIETDQPVPPTEYATARHAGELTKRQVEVLRLVAGGKRNHEIAAELVISERTVAHHIEAIFNKLGISSRTEAVGFVLQNGLPRAPSRR